MLRLYRDLSQEYEVPDLPVWVVEMRMEHVVGSELEVGAEGISSTVKQAEELVLDLAPLERRLLDDAGRQAEAVCPVVPGGGHSSPQGRVHVVCLARTLLGACCEAYAVLKCSRICPPGNRPHNAGVCQKMALLYKDSCHAAVWTSSHAQFLHDLLHQGITACYPGVQSVPSELSEPDLSDLYSRRWNASVSNASDSSSILSLMTRCTNPGSRGWDGMLRGMLENNIGTKRVCANAVAVSVTGMHSCLHPAKRLHWKKRMALILWLSQKGVTNSVVQLCGSPIAFKELMRRFVSSTTSSSYASNAALVHLEHPVSFLYACPYKLPADGLECSSNAFAEVGYKIVEARGSCVIHSLVDAAFRSLYDPPPHGSAPGHGSAPLKWNQGYLGKHDGRPNRTQSNAIYPHPTPSHPIKFTRQCVDRANVMRTGKATASIHHKVPATVMACSLWGMAFRCNFIPFWSHAASKNVRAARLDASQHAAIHSLNSATKLTLLLTDAERMKTQRLALLKPSSGTMNLEEVSSLLGIAGVRGSSCNGGAKGAIDAVRTLGTAGGQGAAHILHFCRIASISENILIYDLGPTVKKLQVKALLKRVLADECYETLEGTDDELLAYVPEHSKHLCACVECRRVASAVATDGGTKWNISFTELGTSASMMSVNSRNTGVNLRCAKRSSASLKTAVACNDQMMDREVEFMDVNQQAVSAMVCDSSTGSTTGTSTRVRRDAKTALEQRAELVPCGHEDMLSIPIVGRALRLWGGWYALCSFCGSCTRFYPYNRYHVHICCMRCDFKMLNRRSNVSQSSTECQTTSGPICRYCGRVRPATHLPLLSILRARHCLTLRLFTLCVFAGRPPEIRCKVEDGQGANGQVGAKRGLAATSQARVLLPQALSPVDTDLHKDDGDARHTLPHCVRRKAVFSSSR